MNFDPFPLELYKRKILKKLNVMLLDKTKDIVSIKKIEDTYHITFKSKQVFKIKGDILEYSNIYEKEPDKEKFRLF